jgi:hypothetical protein
MSDKYFANLEPDKIGEALYEKVTNFYDEVERNGRLELWRKVHRAYYATNTAGYHQASKIERAGEQGELSTMHANHFRNLLQHLHVFVTQQKPTFQCRTINTDVKSQMQTILGRNILEYYLREKRLGGQYRSAAEIAIVYAEAYEEQEWDSEIGDVIAGDPDSGEAIKSGDTVSRIYEPINVIRQTFSDKDKQDWYILRRRVNKHDLVAKYPDKADDILNHSTDSEIDRFYYYEFKQQLDTAEDEDMVWMFTLYHDATPACPSGRVVKFLGTDCVLEYTALSYPVLPINPMIPARQHGTSFGYSISFDLLVVQEAINLLYSTILSNQSAFGVQNLWMKPGTQITPMQLAGGLNILESDSKPESINLTQTPPEIFNFLQGLEKLGEVLSGINSVARGQPEASLKSGAALALIASQAVQFSDSIHSAYSSMLEDSGTGLLRILETRAVLPRATVIAGKNNKSYAKEFVGNDLKGINRVIVDLGNPVSNTIAGRIQMAQDLLQAQVIKSPEQYVQVVETGSTDPLVDEQRNESLLIDSENEALREGKPVQALAIDMHQMHIKSHASVLSGSEERFDPELVQRTLDHIDEHINLLRTVDPSLLNILGMSPIGPNVPPQGENAPQPPENQPQEGPAPGQEPPAQSEQMQAPANSSDLVKQNMPSMPTVPQ